MTVTQYFRFLKALARGAALGASVVLAGILFVRWGGDRWSGAAAWPYVRTAVGFATTVVGLWLVNRAVMKEIARQRRVDDQ